ncbi:hypothetical protein HNQ07_004723 [Deinococcus metalli]|uniref:Uncharacterized protein n=1 Tax=Deinococcus metalli TaxID=1141878 RepID=A0A7W8KL09_9DEIO|nr:hypothetical protein [Deinococcus metalli]GHF65426.1 hypothetical protein GCM10017781_46390 [Deinococcus metalli]
MGTPGARGPAGTGLPAAPQPTAAPSTVPVSSAPLPSPINPAGGQGLHAPGAVAPLPGGGCPSTAPIKVSRKGIYHLPQGDGNYTATKAIVCFATPAAAEQAGYRGIR